MARVSVLRRFVFLLALAACVPAALAQSDWDTWRGLYPRQNYAAAVALQQHAAQSWELPGHRIKSMPTAPYPVPLQPSGSGAIAPHPSGGAVVARGISAPGPGGQVIDVDVRQVIPKRKIAQRIVESIPVVGSAVAGALLIKDLIDAARVMEGPGGTIVMDPGAPKENVSGWYARETYPSNQEAWRSGIYPTKEALCQDIPNLSKYRIGPGTTNPGNTGAVLLYAPGVQNQSVCTWLVYDKEPNCPDFCRFRGEFIWGYYAGSGLTCPEGQVVSFWADDWCTTAPETWPPVPVDEATDRVEQKIAPGAAPEILKELDGKDIGVGGDLPSVQGPSAIHQGRETTSNPDGSTTVKDTTSDIRYGPQQQPGGLQAPGWEWDTRQETRTYPPGEAIPPPGTDTTPPNGGGTVSTGPGGSGLEDLITCGLPWTPACKMDETGTPTAPANTSQQDADGILKPLTDCLSNLEACLPSLPEINWSFQLPSECSVIELPAFADIAPAVSSIDICQFQPTFHDVTSFFWVLAGLAGAIGMVFRDSVGAA